MNKIVPVKFSKTAREIAPEFTAEELYKKAMQSPLFNSSIMQEGVYRSAGWLFNMRPYLNRYFAKIIYEYLQPTVLEIYADTENDAKRVLEDIYSDDDLIEIQLTLNSYHKREHTLCSS